MRLYPDTAAAGLVEKGAVRRPALNDPTATRDRFLGGPVLRETRKCSTGEHMLCVFLTKDRFVD